MPSDTPNNKCISGDFAVRRRRLPHWQVGGSIYFVTFRSARGPLPHIALCQVLRNIQYDNNRRYRLFCAVAMPDHVHILLQPLEFAHNQWYRLEQITKAIKGVSSHRINELIGTKGTVWQEESFDRIVRDEKEFIEKWNYIRNNPVKRGLVEEPEEYEFLLELYS